MTLRATLEAIWNDPKVRCPKHITWWGSARDEDSPTGKLTAEEADVPLFWAKGRRVEGVGHDR